MYAVIETGGKQYRVELGSEIQVDRLDVQPGESITLDRVLLVADGDATAVGRPVVDGATVRADVLAQDRGEKIVVFKYKPKARTRVKQGFRAELTTPARGGHRLRRPERGRRMRRPRRPSKAKRRQEAEKAAAEKATADQELAAAAGRQRAGGGRRSADRAAPTSQRGRGRRRGPSRGDDRQGHGRPKARGRRRRPPPWTSAPRGRD